MQPVATDSIENDQSMIAVAAATVLRRLADDQCDVAEVLTDRILPRQLSAGPGPVVVSAFNSAI